MKKATRLEWLFSCLSFSANKIIPTPIRKQSWRNFPDTQPVYFYLEMVGELLINTVSEVISHLHHVIVRFLILLQSGSVIFLK